MRPLVWFGPLFEPSGYADEGRGMVTALEAADIPVCLSANAVESAGFRQSLPHSQRETLARSAARVPVGEFIQVQHATIDCFNRAHARAVYSVGRSMFETDGLPSHWVSGANALDELWVPGAFNCETFSAAGVRVPIHVVPGGIDSEFFRPDVAPVRIPGLRGTVFLSVFEWRLRKGWDVLLRSWADAFGPHDDVTLVLRTHPIGAIDDRRNSHVINERIDAFLSTHCGGRTRRDIAPIIVMGDRVSGRDLSALYAMANAFVLPTRGEGWGRPFMESMACGVPVIATRWSAHLAFMHDDNSYLLDLERMVAADASEIASYAGQQWAEPSAQHLISQLRRVHADRAEARAIGARARRDMVDDWPWSRSAAAIAARLSVINAQLDLRGREPRAPNAAAEFVVEGGSGDRTVPGSNAFVWLDAAFSATSDAARVGWLTRDPGVRPPYSNPRHAAWQHAVRVADDKALRVTVLDDEVMAAAPTPPRGAWVVDVGASVTTGVPGHLVTTLRDRADQVIVPHDAARDACVDAGVDAARIHVITPTVDITRFAPHGASYRGAVTGGTRFLLIGGDRQHRALPLVVAAYDRAFTADDNVTLHVVLPPLQAGEPTAWRERLSHDVASGRRHSRLPRLAVDTRLIDEDEMPSLYRATDVLVHAGSATGRGRTLREAMACGRPVIATNLVPARDLMDEQCGWLVSPGAAGDADPTALVTALRAACDPAERALRGHRARARAETWRSPLVQRAMLSEYLSELRALVPRQHVGDAMSAGVTPFALDGTRRVVLLAHADWRDGTMSAVVRTYATVCSAGDDVTLALCLDPAQGIGIADANGQVTDAGLAARPLAETMPDVLLIPDRLDGLTLQRLRAAADVVVAVHDRASAATARNADRTVLESLDVATWQATIDHHLAMAHVS